MRDVEKKRAYMRAYQARYRVAGLEAVAVARYRDTPLGIIATARHATNSNLTRYLTRNGVIESAV